MNDGTNIYDFHADGTLMSDGEFDCTADAMGRIVRVGQGGNTLLEIEYDALGRPSAFQEVARPKVSFNYLGNFIEQEKIAFAIAGYWSQSVGSMHRHLVGWDCSKYGWQKKLS